MIGSYSWNVLQFTKGYSYFENASNMHSFLYFHILRVHLQVNTWIPYGLNLTTFNFQENFPCVQGLIRHYELDPLAQNWKLCMDMIWMSHFINYVLFNWNILKSIYAQFGTRACTNKSSNRIIPHKALLSV